MLLDDHHLFRHNTEEAEEAEEEESREKRKETLVPYVGVHIVGRQKKPNNTKD